MKHGSRLSRWIGGIALLAALVGGNIGVGHAMVNTCRTDPIATLSNGQSVTLMATISDHPSDVHGVNFAFHVPTGVTVTKITYDPQYSALEHVTWVADQDTGLYHTDTVVKTGASMVQVVASATTSMRCQLPAKATPGHSGRTIPINFKCQ